MSNKFLKWFRNSTDLQKAVIISIFAGIIITAALIVEKKQESFSSLYIYPDSYTNYPKDNTTSFTYGVKSYEKERTGYDFEVLIGGKIVDKKHFEINPGEVYKENETVRISNDMQFPEKVSLVLKSPFSSYSVHYWLMETKKTQQSVKMPTLTPAANPVVTPSVTSTTSNTTAMSNATSMPNTTSNNTSNTNISATVTPSYTPSSNTSTSYIPTSSNKTPTPVQIDVKRGFLPKEVSIKVGDAVKWTNFDFDENTFTLVSEQGLFTKVLTDRKRFEYRFNASGTYTFYLKEYPNLKGVVNVK